jgi:heat shock protein 1/8
MTCDNNHLGEFNLYGIPPMPVSRRLMFASTSMPIAPLTFYALEKSTGKENKITMTNDKVRLTQHEINRMIQKAEKHRAEDGANKNRIDAKKRH